MSRWMVIGLAGTLGCASMSKSAEDGMAQAERQLQTADKDLEKAADDAAKDANQEVDSAEVPPPAGPTP